MATQHIAIGRAPVDIVADLTLTSGQQYLIQPIGRCAVRLAEGALAPADPDHSHSILPGRTWTIGASSLPIWVWTDDDRGSALVVTEAS